MRSLRSNAGTLLKTGGATGLAVMVAALSVANAAKGPANILVKTTVFNTADASALRVQSDGAIQAVYETTTVGRNTTVSSTIYSFNDTVGQDFFLTTYYSAKGGFLASGRTLRIDMSDQRAGGAFLTPDLGSGYVPVQVGVKCRLAVPSPINMAGMTSGQSVECPGSLRFWAPDGQWYRFSFQPENFSNSDYWKVTCAAAGSQGCRTWTITPSGTDGTSVNTLLRIDAAGNILDVGGDYGLTYSFLVER